MSDTLVLLERALDQTGGLVAAVTPEQRHAPTPCSGWDVSDLVGHVVYGLDNFTASARGEKPEWGRPRPPVEGDWSAAFRTRAAALLDAWRSAPEDRRPQAELQITEQAVHSWDLARATGHPAAELDAEVGEQALRHGRAMLKPEYRGAGGNNAFGDEVPVPDDAPLYDRLAGWFGRDPAWQPG
ncbi:MAG TPA: TIGR03086 family metal-binding protein [Candidatus Dormibacteraeota bacterium]|nr:TIGR03086 family metal-binding protein [Candidatus Dormibacteraeota bacterium]